MCSDGKRLEGRAIEPIVMIVFLGQGQVVRQHAPAGAHDDLVTALGLAVQEKPQTVRVTFFDLDEPEERGGWRRMS